MKRSNRLILLIGLFLAVVAFVGVIMLTGNTSSGGGTPTTTAAPTTAKVVKAATDIAAGTNVTASMVELDEVPIGASGGDAIGDTGLAIGKTIRQSVTKGETILYSYFVSSGVETNVTDALPRGLRAIAVQVSQITGVGTLIQNGDHVDVVISMKIQNVIPDPVNKGNVVKVGDPEGSVKMVLQNALVVGTLLPPPPASTAQATPTPTPSGEPGTGSQGPSTSLNGQSEMVMRRRHGQPGRDHPLRPAVRGPRRGRQHLARAPIAQGLHQAGREREPGPATRTGTRSPPLRRLTPPMA